MTWELVAALAVGLGALVALAHVVLPFLRKRSDEQTRLQALEAANVQLSDRLARCEQTLEGGGLLGRLPRAGVSR